MTPRIQSPLPPQPINPMFGPVSRAEFYAVLAMLLGVEIVPVAVAVLGA